MGLQNSTFQAAIDEHADFPGLLHLVNAMSAREEVAAQNLLEGLPDEVALVDGDWNILSVNTAWKKSAVLRSAPLLLRGGNYYRFCETGLGEPELKGACLLKALSDIASGRRTRIWHSCSAPVGDQRIAYRICISRMEGPGQAFAMICRYEVSELARLRDQCKALGGSVLDIQNGERRRIGRELHDSTAQLLVALQLDLMRLKQCQVEPAAAPIFEDVAETIDKIHAEIRATSYIFHPPALSGRPLCEALEDLAAGFGKRTGITTRIACHLRSHRFSAICESTAFRIAQEALANVHRHARASAVEVRFAQRGDCLHLIVSDDGIGVPDRFCGRRGQRVAFGVGIAGMEERLAQLGGRLTFRRQRHGTCLTARIPMDTPISECGQPEKRSLQEA